MQIEWRRIWKVLLGCVCTAAGIALLTCGQSADQLAKQEVDAELDEVPAHYEVELHTAWGEFEYLVDAYTGKVISGQKDLLTTASTPSTPNVTTKPSDQKPDPSGTAQDIGYAKAKSIALNHAGVSENERFLRTSSAKPSSRSKDCTCWEMADCEMKFSSAAAEKLPRRTTD